MYCKEDILITNQTTNASQAPDCTDTGIVPSLLVLLFINFFYDICIFNVYEQKVGYEKSCYYSFKTYYTMR